jgi:signal transduction histidine kinase
MAAQLWRVVSFYRVITLCYAAVLILRDHGSYAHPAAGLAALAFMVGWTCVTVAAYRRPAGRTAWLITLDLGIAVALILSTRLIDTAARINAGAPTIPTAWAAAPVLACGVASGPWAGFGAALLIAAADLVEHPTISSGATFNGIVLTAIAGTCGGYLLQFGRRAEAEIASAARRDAAAAERERITRGIHDSVLQVLALISSRGQALGGEAAELGKLAGEQEGALRALLASGGDQRRPLGGLIDVRSLIGPLADARITVSCPATPVLLPAVTATALSGAVAAALDNVARHAGPGARAWVLVEDEEQHVTVSVRDDGAGFSEGRLAVAAAEGRLGVSHSIVGRVREVGGTASLTSAPGLGTEVELRVSRT